MKKLATLLLAAGMVVASTAPANAVDVKIDGMYRHTFATGEMHFAGKNFESMMHRMRLGLTMAASENLSAYVQFQINHGNQYGVTTNKHGNTGSYAITARQMYLDWTVPGTAAKVRMGRFALGLPAEAFGDNSILAASWGNREGVAVTAPVNDWLGLSAMWTRVGTDATTDLDQANNTDVFAAAANLKFDGFSGAVYAAYAAHDGYGTKDVYAHNATTGVWEIDEKGVSKKPANAYGLPNAEGDAYWLGFTSTFSAFDPFTLKVSAAYGEFNAREKGVANENGWNVQVKAAYELPFATAVLGGWYFSGADKDGKGVMPSAGAYHSATSGYYDGSKGLIGMQGFGYVTGQWAIQAGLEGMSFIDGLSHDFKVTYMQGTNDEKFAKKKADANIAADKSAEQYLSEDESIVEFDFVSTYKIYKNLSATLELVYMIADFDKKVHADMDKDDWTAQLIFNYKF